MAEHQAAEANDDCYDLTSLLSGAERDFLDKNNDEKIEIDKLKGKKIGLYFSASWCSHCQQFTPTLVGVYNELSSKGDFEIILVSFDIFAEPFRTYFAKMPWLAIPFSDEETLDRLSMLFKVKAVPQLVILDEEGKLLAGNGVAIINQYGAEGYPFSPERIREIKKNQSLRSLLVSPSSDFVISNDEKKVPVSELIGKIVGLYFLIPSYGQWDFDRLVEIHNKLKEMGENFEIVMISMDDEEKEEESFRERLRTSPWFALPFKDQRNQKLLRYFGIQKAPTLVIIGPDGKTLQGNAWEAIEVYGIQAYPFTPEKLEEIKKAEVEKAGWPQKVKKPFHREHELALTWLSDFRCEKCTEIGSKWAYHCEECVSFFHTTCALEEDNGTVMDKLSDVEEMVTKGQSLSSLLVSPSRDFVLSNDEKKVPVSELEGKMVGLYFFSPTYDQRLEFNQKLVEVYNKLKEMRESFEIVMLYLYDDDVEKFQESFRSMPWFALPFEDDRCQELFHQFKLQSLPALVIIGADGRTVHPDVADAIDEYGIRAYPFTQAKFAALAEMEKARDEAQTLESILVSGNQDFVIMKDGAKVPVSDLVGKNILLYFSANWSPLCSDFLPKFIEAYHKMKAKDDSLEVIFVSYDSDRTSFDEFFSRMPWLALPFGDARRHSLTVKFKVRALPTVVAIGPTGKTLTTEAADLIKTHGANAYSFIFEKTLKKDEKGLDEKMVKNDGGEGTRGTMMNKLRLMLQFLIQKIVAILKKLGFLS